MEVSASIPYIKVDISDYEAGKITLSVISKKFEIGRDHFIDDTGWLCENNEIGAGIHSCFEVAKIREATELDKAIILILKKL